MCRALAAALLALAVAGPASADGPHLVVVLADDLGYSDLGSYGGEIETPHLDRLARQGVRFTHFYATPRCSPTRAALLTGRHPHEAGLGHLNRDWHRPGYRGVLDPGAATLAEILSGAGYRTYMAGKWHLAPAPRAPVGERERKRWPRARGFDRFFGTIVGSGSYFEPASLVRGETLVEPGEDFYYTDAISAEASRFVRDHFAEHPARPFFLYLAYTAPHWPLHAPPEVIRKYRGRYDRGWDALREERYRRMVAMGLVPAGSLAPRDDRAGPWREAEDKAWQARRMEVYAAMVERMDAGIGQLLAAIDAAGAGDDTLVLFLSDNGACAEEFRGLNRLGAWTLPIPESHRASFGDRPDRMPGPADTFQTYGPGWSHLSNTPFRGHKHSTHEGGIAVPLIVRGPAAVAAGSLIAAPGHVVDLLPTLLEVAGARHPRPEVLRGESLLPLLRGAERERGPMFWEHEGNRGVRDGRFKLVSRWPGRWQLYDLAADRTELRDLAAAQPERVRAMAALYAGFAEASGVEAWPWVVPQVRWLTAAATGVLVVAVVLIRRRRRR